MTIKERTKKLEHSHSALGRSVFFLVRQVWLLARFLSDESYRSGILTRIWFGRYYHQQSTFTASNRYPLLFQACADYLTSEKRPKIMSFGCSTGEEVFSIGQYLPHATIVGVDINRWCLKQCRKTNKNQAYSFVHRFSKDFENASDFDAIFCLAVFQRTENRMNKNNIVAQGFIFEQFEQEVKILDEKLKAGGLLIIDHADFRFEDIAVAKKYIPLSSFEQNKIQRNRPLFDRENRKIAEEHNCFRAFVKT